MQDKNTSDLIYPQKKISLADRMGYSGIATLISHPARVWLNLASQYTNPLATIKASHDAITKGIFFNMTRGSLAAGSQSYIKESIQAHVGVAGSIISAGICGSSIACVLETPFIRIPFFQNTTPFSLWHYLLERSLMRKNSIPAVVPFPLWRFNPILTGLYFTREAGFSTVVLAKNDLPVWGQHIALLSGAWITATAHKFVVFEAVRDTLSQQYNIPDFRDGLRYTIKSMAYGNVYNHPSLKVPIDNPQTYSALIRNLATVSCGSNMYFFRLFFLVVFRESYDTVARHSQKKEGIYRLFSKNTQKNEDPVADKSDNPRWPTRHN